MKREVVTPLDNETIEFLDRLVNLLVLRKEMDLANEVRLFVNRKRGYVYKKGKIK